MPVGGTDENAGSVRMSVSPIHSPSPRFSILLILLLILFHGVEPAHAQATQSRFINIGVTRGLSVYVNHGLDFGTLVANTGTHSVAVTDANAGKVTISAVWFFPVTVTLTPPANLVNGSNSIPYTPLAAYNNTADNPSGSTSMPPSGSTSGIWCLANISGWIGYAYVYLYGSVNVGNVPPGTYSGTYTVAVAY